MKEQQILISFRIIEDDQLLESRDRKLVIASEEARSRAYAPYSGFFVGAAVLLDDGSVISGNNQENAAYPSGLCAERVAIFSALANHPEKEIVSIAISSHTPHGDPAAPCGACRQVIQETQCRQEKDIRLLLSDSSGKVLLFDKATDLLPMAFKPEALKKE